MDDVAFSFCECGCGKQLRGRITGTVSKRKYFPGHKPKRVIKTPEERSEASKKMWDTRGRVEKILSDCACGCGEKVKGKWAWGHHSRVNNISKREDIREMRRTHFIKLHEQGKLPNWNRGLTKESDERVAENVIGLKNWLNSEEGKSKSSEKMKEQWKSGSIVPLTGSNHSQWQGGTSSICQRIRGNRILYKLWKYPILIRDGFVCTKCAVGSSAVLNVHHNVELFADIIKKFIPEDKHELTWEEESTVVDDVISYHISNNVSGITLCESCHDKEHDRK